MIHKTRVSPENWHLKSDNSRIVKIGNLTMDEADKGYGQKRKMNQKNAGPFKSVLDVISPENLRLRISEKTFMLRKDSSWVCENRVWSDHDLFVCFKGQAHFIENSKKYLLTPGQALLVPAGTRFSAWVRDKSRLEAFCQHFTLTLFGHMDLFSLIEFRRITSLSHWPMVKNTIEL